MLSKGEIWPFISGFIIIGFIIGAILLALGFRRAGHFLFLILIFMIAFPFIWELLPHWVTLIFMAFIALVFLQIVATFFFGKGAADAMIGNLAAYLVRSLVQFLILPLKIIRQILSMINRGN